MPSIKYFPFSYSYSLLVAAKVERGIPYARERFFKGGHFNLSSGIIPRRLRRVKPKGGHDTPTLASGRVIGLADMQDPSVPGGSWSERVHGTTQRLRLVVFQEEEQAKLLTYDGESYDLIDVRRLERILVEVLEQEVAPVLALIAPPPGRFAIGDNNGAGAAGFGPAGPVGLCRFFPDNPG